MNARDVQDHRDPAELTAVEFEKDWLPPPPPNQLGFAACSPHGSQDFEDTLDTSEQQQTKSADKRPTRRIRLPGPKKMLATVLQRMEKLVQTGTLAESKLADVLIRQSEIALMLYREQTSAQRRHLIDENKRLTAEVAELKAKVADEDPDVRRMLEYKDSGRVKELESEVERLKAAVSPAI